jgi:excinuclease ABC subunit C
VAPQPIFEHEIDFDPTQAAAALRALPTASGVVALFGHNATDKPHMLRAANLRRRMQNLLQPAEGQTKRLNLRDRIARIAWREAGSDFEALLVLHRAMSLAFGTDEARKRMRLSAPYTIRFAAENAYPRIYVTNHLRRRSLPTTFGPFASRFAAERYCEAVEDLFLIRRCYLELHPSPDDPGCIYGEMNKCLAPCQQRVSDETYSDECARVLSFLQTRGASRMKELEAERDDASANMLFEEAAAAHARITKVKAAAALADDLVQPLSDIRAILVMPCASHADDTEPHVALFAFADGCFRGPQRVSMLGVRLAREQADVGTSLFAQPMMLAAVPLEDAQPRVTDERVPHVREANVGVPSPAPQEPTASPEERLLAAIATLEDGSEARDTTELGDHLALLKRWYYRPEKQRTGAIFFREREAWPIRRMIRAAARIAMPPETQAAVDTMEPSFHAQAQSTRRKK